MLELNNSRSENLWQNISRAQNEKSRARYSCEGSIPTHEDPPASYDPLPARSIFHLCTNHPHHSLQPHSLLVFY